MNPVSLVAPMAADEQHAFERCETAIERGLQTFIEVGAALVEIRDRKLYRATHRTFEDYCHERWGISRPHTYRLMSASEVAADLSPVGDISTVPERHLRPLAALETPDARREAWQRAVETAPGGKVTAKHVEQVVAEIADDAPALDLRDADDLVDEDELEPELEAEPEPAARAPEPYYGAVPAVREVQITLSAEKALAILDANTDPNLAAAVNEALDFYRTRTGPIYLIQAWQDTHARDGACRACGQPGLAWIRGRELWCNHCSGHETTRSVLAAVARVAGRSVRQVLAELRTVAAATETLVVWRALADAADKE